MNTFLRSPEFDAWLSGMGDFRAKARILARLRSATLGNFGDCEPVGGGVSEMRIHVGPGYRLYFARIGATVYVLLCGGDKAAQKRDIQRAKRMAGELTENDAVSAGYAPFDVAEYLDNDEVIAEYLTAAIEDPNPDVFLAALGDVAKARGMAQIARKTGLGREKLVQGSEFRCASSLRDRQGRAACTRRQAFRRFRSCGN